MSLEVAWPRFRDDYLCAVDVPVPQHSPPIASTWLDPDEARSEHESNHTPRTRAETGTSKPPRRTYPRTTRAGRAMACLALQLGTGIPAARAGMLTNVGLRTARRLRRSAPDDSPAVRARAREILSASGASEQERASALAWLEASSPASTATTANTPVPQHKTRDESADLQHVDSTRCHCPSGSNEPNGENACGTPERVDVHSEPVIGCHELQRIRRRLLEGRATDEVAVAIIELVADAESTIGRLARCGERHERSTASEAVSTAVVRG
jgi:hypothetical protein